MKGDCGAAGAADERTHGRPGIGSAMLLSELCDVLGVDLPDPANTSTEANDYAFECVVQETGRDGTVSNKRIDLYRRGSFVLEAKQSRWKGGRKDVGTDQEGGPTIRWAGRDGIRVGCLANSSSCDMRRFGRRTSALQIPSSTPHSGTAHLVGEDPVPHDVARLDAECPGGAGIELQRGPGRTVRGQRLGRVGRRLAVDIDDGSVPANKYNIKR